VGPNNSVNAGRAPGLSKQIRAASQGSEQKNAAEGKTAPNDREDASSGCRSEKSLIMALRKYDKPLVRKRGKQG